MEVGQRCADQPVCIAGASNFSEAPEDLSNGQGLFRGLQDRQDGVHPVESGGVGRMWSVAETLDLGLQGRAPKRPGK